jgi:hypothetical protein
LVHPVGPVDCVVLGGRIPAPGQMVSGGRREICLGRGLCFGRTEGHSRNLLVRHQPLLLRRAPERQIPNQVRRFQFVPGHSSALSEFEEPAGVNCGSFLSRMLHRGMHSRLWSKSFLRLRRPGTSPPRILIVFPTDRFRLSIYGYRHYQRYLSGQADMAFWGHLQASCLTIGDELWKILMSGCPLCRIH